MTTIIELLYKFDKYLTNKLQKNSFTSNLLITPTSKFITEILIIIFLSLISYEIIYWSGIYLKIWEYHAKDIFTEIPIHCAHININLNLVKGDKIDQLNEYYFEKQNQINFLNLLKQNSNKTKFQDLFEFSKFIKYYFEFSPDDFEMNKEPEFGSTILHLRKKILKLFNESEIYNDYNTNQINVNDVKIYNNLNHEVPIEENGNYLSKCNIETGNIIDVIIII
ncbi:uncharacterized protein KGF55_001221 [Candida pseudojiufengensis]|uniref:uncharacterized protein n=1 Tax=Candida pseudojiufengensis TaxID=497109 RepID=UPI00222420FD|nr:uncharacterized protein KGF55_001221 [Candida pseudojiufengensis]KAI5965858.1 hypothetical protein KGF55_001221 [Candida pseudojiufengensis]